jgi:hypothetical protein
MEALRNLYFSLGLIVIITEREMFYSVWRWITNIHTNS